MAIMMSWGLNISVVKALTAVLPDIWVGTLRMLVASAVLTCCLLARDRRLPRFERRQLLALCGAGFLMVYANQLLFVRGMHLSTATSAALIMALSPAITVVIASLFFRERMSWLQWLGIALGLGGVALVILNRSGASAHAAGLGELVVLSAMLTFVFGGAIVQRLARRLDPLVMGWAIYTSGTLMLLVHFAITQDSLTAPLQAFDTRTWLLMIYSGVFGTAISNVGWYHAIATVGMARASLFFYWLPIFGMGFAALFLGEQLSVWHAAGLLLVLSGTRLGTAAKLR